jgi:hydrogenase nickel incorporation protein HypB
MVRIKVMKAVSTKNDEVAAGIRAELAGQGIKALNIISSPGSGKTTLLERTIAHFAPDIRSAVIVGDPFTANDAERLESAGGDAFQLNTEGSCHLTAPMVRAALDDMDLAGIKLLFIENIGNLICPTAWDLGESARVTLLSVTEGTDKVDKYRRAFHIAHCVLITKTDLAPSCDFDLKKATTDIQALNSNAAVLPLSAKTGDGLDAWYDWVSEHLL